MESSNASLPAYLKFLILLWEIAVRIFYGLGSRRLSDFCLFSSPPPPRFSCLTSFFAFILLCPFKMTTNKKHTKKNLHILQAINVSIFWLKACKGSCLAYNQLRKCGCMHYRFPRPPGTKVCDVLNKTEGKIFCYITICSPIDMKLMLFFMVLLKIFTT